MDKRTFSVDEANSLIPALEIRFAKMMQLRAQLRTAYEELESLGETPDADTLARTSGSPELRRARGKFRALMEALGEELEAIEQTGVTVKDLEIGLCDFLGTREGREVWLCWQFGEKSIRYWHDLDAGFSGRRPIDPKTSEGLLH